MKKRRILPLAVGLLLSAPLLLGADVKTLKLRELGPVAVGKKAPPVASWGLDDNVVTLAGLLKQDSTRAVVLAFYATWCTECPRGLKALESGRDRLSEAGIRVLLVNHGEGKEAVSRFHSEKRLTLPVVLDEFKEISRAYGVVEKLPRAFLIVRDGTVRAIYLFEGDDFVEQVCKDAANR